MPKLTDQALATKATRYRELKAQASDLEAQAQAVQIELLHELDRRGADRVDLGGLKVSAITSTRTTYDTDKAKASLPAAVFRRITTVVVTKLALRAEVEAGRVSEDDVAAFSTETASSPYIRVAGAA